MKKHTFLIKSTKNQSFGTAFCIKQNKNGSYFVTCSHVVEDCGEDNLIIDNYPAKLIAKGSREDIDLAVVFVEGLFDCSVLKLFNESVEIHQEFTIDGFEPYKKGSYKLEKLKGSIKKISQIYSNAKSIDTYELNIGDGDSIERGYSGSAIVCDGFVVAVATDRNTNGKQAYAVPIGYLGEIWEDMPDDIFVKISKNGLEKLKSELIEENSPLREITKKVLWFVTFFRKHPFLSILFIILYFGYERQEFIFSKLQSLKIQEKNQTIVRKQLLKGVVKDIDGGIELENVIVRILEKNLKFTTDKDGKYQFSVDGNEGDIVELDFEKDDYILCDKNDIKQRLGEERNVLLCKDF